MAYPSQATLAVHLQPGAKRDELLGFRNGVLWVRVTSLPSRGQANRALLKLLADALGLATGDVHLIRGHAARHKVVAIRGLDQEELQERLAKALASERPG